MNTTFYPKCPHCGYEFDDEETWHSNYLKSGKVNVGDYDGSDLTCPNLDCGKEFTVTCIHEIKFEASEQD